MLSVCVSVRVCLDVKLLTRLAQIVTAVQRLVILRTQTY